MCQHGRMAKLTLTAQGIAQMPSAAFDAFVAGLRRLRGEQAAPDDEALKAIGDGHGGDADDFAWEALRALWARAELAFTGYLDEVLDALDELFTRGDLSHPFVPGGGHEQLVYDTLAAKAAKFLANLGIHPLSAVEVKARAPWAFDLIGQGYRLGLLGDQLEPKTSWASAQDLLRRHAPTAADKEAMAYMRSAGGSYIRPIVQEVGDDVIRALTQRDREVAQRRALAGVRARLHPGRLSGYMADLTGHKVRREDGHMVWRDGDWSRDWRRVARTELADAHAHGHLMADLKKLPENANKPEMGPLQVPKRLVFKITQAPRYDDKGRLIAPCKHCYRLWRTDNGGHRLYDLAQVIENGHNAVGEDGKARKADEWLATVGPTHPNDVCGPLQFATSVSPMLFPGMDEEFRRFEGKGYAAVDDWAAREGKRAASAGEGQNG